MKNMKRLLGLILATSLLIGCLPISAFAQETASGACGDNATWVLDEREILTISGTGPIAYDAAFWKSYRTEIQSIIVNEGITKINDGTFSHLANTTNISLPNSLKSIGAAAFYGNSNLSTITIPPNVESMGFDVFYDCSSLAEIFFTGDVLTFDDLTFNNITATVYYPASNSTCAVPFLCGIPIKVQKWRKPLHRNRKSVYAASRNLCLTTLDILAINSPLVGFPFSALMVLPK